MSPATQTTLTDNQRVSLQFFTGCLPTSLFDFSKPSNQEQAKAAIPVSLINPDPIAWIEEHFFIPETRGPIVLDDYQKQALREALSLDDDGLFRYSTIVYSDIKKSAKSTIAAAVTLWRAFQVDATDGWGSLYIIANDLKQADSRVAYYMRRAIQLNPLLRALCRVKTGAYKVTLPNQTFIEAIPIDPSGEAGSNADMVVFSELWGAHSKAQAQMWTEATLPPNKFGKSFRWVETYAGIKGEAPILEQLFENGVVLGRRLDSDLAIFDNPAMRLFVMWNQIPRLPWQTETYYAQERGVLLPSEFQRVHRNEWSDGGAEKFIDIQLWDACKEELPPLGKHEPCILAMDGSESDDSFPLVLISRHPTEPARFAVRYCRIFTPDAPGIVMDDAPIEQEVRRLCATYAVQQIAYDRALIGQLMRRLTTQTEGGPAPIPVPIEKFNQGGDRLESDKGLYDAITQRRIAHDGHEGLRAHVANANKKKDSNGRIRIVKRTHSLKIDACVATGMGLWRAGEILAMPATGFSMSYDVRSR